jgi:glycosyltransferase involved in cell wall biosynthesis
MTIHDLASELFPEFFSLKTRLWHKFINPRKIANSADRILAVSNFTKDELGRVWQIPAEKISVTSLAAKVSRSRFSPKNLPPKFVLALSTLEPRKNLRTLIAAFAEFQKENSTEIELLIAGDFDSKIFADPKIPKIQGVRFLGKISEAEKFQLLAAAEVFCFPSIYEGFGIPPLEAMQCGTPVLAADIPAIREVCGEAAKFIPPKNVDAWKVALAKILTNAELRKNLSKRGLARAGRFSWEETARKTIEVFNNLVI